MRYACSLAGAVVALGLTLVAAPGEAAPVGGVAGDLKTAAGEVAPIEQVRHRCYRHRGHWHCPRHRYYRPYYGPGVYFNFGPRRHYHGHHRHHRHHGHHRRHRHH
jgi:hypothetical protein